MLCMSGNPLNRRQECMWMLARVKSYVLWFGLLLALGVARRSMTAGVAVPDDYLTSQRLGVMLCSR